MSEKLTALQVCEAFYNGEILQCRNPRTGDEWMDGPSPNWTLEGIAQYEFRRPPQPDVLLTPEEAFGAIFKNEPLQYRYEPGKGKWRDIADCDDVLIGDMKSWEFRRPQPPPPPETMTLAEAVAEVKKRGEGWEMVSPDQKQRMSAKDVEHLSCHAVWADHAISDQWTVRRVGGAA